MKKTFASMLGSLVVVASVALAGCGNKAVNPAACVAPPPPPPPSSGAAATLAGAPPSLPGFVKPTGEAAVLVAPHGKASVVRLADGHNAFFGLLTLAAGAAVPEHRDPTEEYIYVLSGSGVVTINGDSYAVSPQSVIYMPAGALVTFSNGPEELTAIQVFAGPGPADKYDTWKPAAPAAPTGPGDAGKSNPSGGL